MSEDRIRCPDCGRLNAAGSTSCAQCNFPLSSEGTRPSAPPEAPNPVPEPISAEGPGSSPAAPSPVPPLRRRPPRPRMQQQAMSLWLVFAGVAAAVVIFTGVKANLDRASEPVEGAAPVQQEQVDDLRAALERDSTNVDARIRLADVLYDTGNWQEAARNYEKAVALDSTRVTAIVDLGVCYYNLGEGPKAERLFHLALARDPTQPVALFNLGILHERRKDYEESLKYFHRALASNPPDDMKPVIVDAMQRLQQLTGRTPPPLPGNSP